MAQTVIERINVSEVRELVTMPPNGTSTFSFDTGGIFYIPYVLSGTINVTNIPVVSDSVTSVTFMSPKGSMARPTTFQVNGVAYPVKWAGGTVPAASSSGMNYWTFNIAVINATIVNVAGSLVVYS